jgi:hypothetical protein
MRVARLGFVTPAALAVLLVSSAGRALASPPVARVGNRLVAADMDRFGRWTAGSLEGSPFAGRDNDKSILYGFRSSVPSAIGTSYTTVRIQAAGQIEDHAPGLTEVYDARVQPSPDQVAVTWAISSLAITHTLSLANNPYSGRQDMLRIDYDLRNVGGDSLNAGIRLMLDVQLGDNDGAPYLVPGVGRIGFERLFSAADVPEYWLAYENVRLDPDYVRAVGLMTGEQATPPDGLAFARWRTLFANHWDLALDPAVSLEGDNGVALYWTPQQLAPGQRRGLTTYLGLGGDVGGQFFLVAPVGVACRSVFNVALFASGSPTGPVVPSLASLVLPLGLDLAPGDVGRKALGPISSRDTASVTWHVLAAAAGSHDVRATLDFTDGSSGLTSPATITVDCREGTPAVTATATQTLKPLPSPTPTPSATPRAPTVPVSPTTTLPPPGTACQPREGVCDGSILVRVFEDKDCNGQFDTGRDRFLEGIEVAATLPDGSRQVRSTSRHGTAILGRMRVTGAQRINLEVLYPETHSGLRLAACHNSPTGVSVELRDFQAGFGSYVRRDFRATLRR